MKKILIMLPLVALLAGLGLIHSPQAQKGKKANSADDILAEAVAFKGAARRRVSPTTGKRVAYNKPTTEIRQVADWAYDPNNQIWAHIDSQQNLIKTYHDIFPKGLGRLSSENKTQRRPQAIHFKRVGAKGYFCVYSQEEGQIEVFESKTLAPYTSFNALSMVASSQESKDSLLFYRAKDDPTAKYPKRVLHAFDLRRKKALGMVEFEGGTQHWQAFQPSYDGQSFFYASAVASRTFMRAKIKVRKGKAPELVDSEEVACFPSRGQFGGKGQFIISGGVYEASGENEIQAFPFSALGALEDRAIAFGIQGGRLHFASLNDGRRLASLGFKGDEFRDFGRFSASNAFAAFHDDKNQRLALAFGDKFFSIDLEALQLPQEPLLSFVMRGKKTIVTERPATWQAEFLGDSGTLKLLEGPEGMILKGHSLSWTPPKGRFGPFKVRIESRAGEAQVFHSFRGIVSGLVLCQIEAGAEMKVSPFGRWFVATEELALPGSKSGERIKRISVYDTQNGKRLGHKEFPSESGVRALGDEHCVLGSSKIGLVLHSLPALTKIKTLQKPEEKSGNPAVRFITPKVLELSYHNLIRRIDLTSGDDIEEGLFATIPKGTRNIRHFALTPWNDLVFTKARVYRAGDQQLMEILAPIFDSRKPGLNLGATPAMLEGNTMGWLPAPRPHNAINREFSAPRLGRPYLEAMRKQPFSIEVLTRPLLRKKVKGVVQKHSTFRQLNYRSLRSGSIVHRQDFTYFDSDNHGREQVFDMGDYALIAKAGSVFRVAYDGLKGDARLLPLNIAYSESPLFLNAKSADEESIPLTLLGSREGLTLRLSQEIDGLSIAKDLSSVKVNKAKMRKAAIQGMATWAFSRKSTNAAADTVEFLKAQHESLAKTYPIEFGRSSEHYLIPIYFKVLLANASGEEVERNLAFIGECSFEEVESEINAVRGNGKERRERELEKAREELKEKQAKLDKIKELQKLLKEGGK